MIIFPGETKKIRDLFCILFFFSVSPAFTEETITVTAKYPSLSGTYNELSTSGNAYLATDSGNVGIGTKAPSVNLEVSGDNLNVRTFVTTPSQGTSSELRVYNSSGNAFAALTANGPTSSGSFGGIPLADATCLVSNSASRFFIGAAINIPLYFATNNLPRLTVMGDGNVGIGTTDPQHALDVNGAMYSRRYHISETSGEISIDWSNGNVQSVQLSGSDVTFYFESGQDGGKYILIIGYTANSEFEITWPASIRWSGGGAEPTWTFMDKKTDYVIFIYNGVDSAYDATGTALNFG